MSRNNRNNSRLSRVCPTIFLTVQAGCLGKVCLTSIAIREIRRDALGHFGTLSNFVPWDILGHTPTGVSQSVPVCPSGGRKSSRGPGRTRGATKTVAPAKR